MMPFGNLGVTFAQQGEFLESNPFAGMIIEQRKREAEEKRRREEEELRRVAEEARQKQFSDLRQQANESGFPGAQEANRMRAEAAGQSLEEVNTQIANQDPEEIRQQKLRQAWGMQEGQQKPTFGQRTATILMEMVRGMAQGPNYRPIAERVQEEAQKEYALKTARMGQLNAAERINALTQKSQALEAWQRQKFDEEMKFKQRQAENKFKVDSLNAITRDKTQDEKVRHNKQLEFMQANNVRLDAMNTAAAMAGVGKTLKENEDGTFSFELDLSDPDKQQTFLDALKKVNKAKAQPLPDRTIETQNETMQSVVNPNTGQLELVPVKTFKRTRVTHGDNSAESPTQTNFLRDKNLLQPTSPVAAPSPASIPDVPAPSTRTPSDDFRDVNETLRRYPKLTPQEATALVTNKTAVNDLTRSIEATSDEFLKWVKGGMKGDMGIGEFLQTPKILGKEPLRPFIEQWNKLKVNTMAADDAKGQDWVRRYNAIIQPFEKAKVASMFGEGGKNLTGTERELVQKYWSNASEGPQAFLRGQVMTAGMITLGMQRMSRKITPTEENDLNRELESYVADTVSRMMKNPDKFDKSALDPAKFIPRLQALKETERRKAPSSNTVRPPVVKDSGKPPTETKSVDEFNQTIKKEQEKKGWKTRSGATIRRVG